MGDVSMFQPATSVQFECTPDGKINKRVWESATDCGAARGLSPDLSAESQSERQIKDYLNQKTSNNPFLSILSVQFTCNTANPLCAEPMYLQSGFRAEANDEDAITDSHKTAEYKENNDGSHDTVLIMTSVAVTLFAVFIVATIGFVVYRYKKKRENGEVLEEVVSLKDNDNAHVQCSNVTESQPISA